MTLIDKISQAQYSTTYSVITSILFLPIYFFITIIGLAFGLIERTLLNKRIYKPPAKLAVIITGCSTGFGFNLVLSLASKGITVFAGVRKNDDAQRIKESSEYPENVVPIIADVTNPEQLKEAYELVKNHIQENGLKLLALVNNAGYGYYSPIETANLQNVKNMFEVNVFGVLNATQVFVPLLRDYGSNTPLSARIINISSGAGQVVIPPSGTYCSTKFALEALSDAMRIELSPWGIHVAVVEPGRFNTEFQDKAYIGFESGGIGQITPEVENHYKKLVQIAKEESQKMIRPNNKSGVSVIEDALFDTIPLGRYLTGKDVQLGVPILQFLKNEKIIDRIIGKKWRSFQK